MADRLKLKAGAAITSAAVLYEGYETGDSYITANVGIDKIEGVLQHFIAMHEEPLFFILEIPTNACEEAGAASGVADALHKDVYYIDGCSQEEALLILRRAGKLLCNDGISSFGYGGHESGDEIMFGKYNVLTIYSRSIEKYAGFFDEHEIEKTDRLITARDTFTRETPGMCKRYEIDGKTVFDLPKEFEKWGMYFAERREDD